MSHSTPPTRAGGRQTVWTVGTLVYTLGGLVLLFGWLLWGDFALSMRDRSVGPLVEKFLLKHGASNTLKQVLMSTLPTVIGLVLGPAVSYSSDRTRSRRGRRIPYLLIPTPIAGLAMVGIAFCPRMGEWLYTITGHVPAAGVPVHQAAGSYTLAIFTAFWMVFEVACIVSGSVFGGLINDVVPRSVLGRFHGLFRAVSLFDGILFNALLFQHAQQHFTLMFALIGLLFGGGFALMCLKVKEGDYPPVPETVEADDAAAGPLGRFLAPVRRFFAAAAGYLRECYSRPYYLLLFAMTTLAGLTFRPINEFSIRYAAQLGMPDGDYGFFIAISFVVSLILAFPLGMLVDRFHPLRMALASLVLYCATSLYGALFVHDARTFAIALVAHTILSGTYFTCAASIGQQLMPRSKFSQYASAGGIVAAVVSLIYAPIMGAILDLSKTVVPVGGVPTPQYNYQLTFWGGLFLSTLTAVAMVAVYRRFQAYGGLKGYVAPGDAEGVPARLEPPAHIATILPLYLVGAALGVAVGYGLGFEVQHGVAREFGVGLLRFHELVIADKGVRNLTTLCIAVGVVPFAVLGGIVGSRLAKRA